MRSRGLDNASLEATGGSMVDSVSCPSFPVPECRRITTFIEGRRRPWQPEKGCARRWASLDALTGASDVLKDIRLKTRLPRPLENPYDLIARRQRRAANQTEPRLPGL